MEHSNVTLPTLYLVQITEMLTEAGIDAEAWLQAFGFEKLNLVHETVSLSWQDLNTYLLNAERSLKHQSLGLMLGTKLSINTHGSLGFAAMSGGSTRQVIELLERFLHLRTDLMTVEVTETHDSLKVRFVESRDLNGLRRILTETIVLAICNILKFITLGASPVQQVRFQFVGDNQFAERYFECPVLYSAEWTGFSLPLRDVDKPLKLANKRGFESAIAICEQELEKLNANESLSFRVHKIMLQSQGRFPSLDITARRLYMTQATLHRHLVKEGTSYREILESVRRQLAYRYLQENQMTIKEISYALGYSEVSNFRKAFKRWYGIAPSKLNMQELNPAT
ncbi:AraC family transcriptional regulator [Alteromonas facilis]|uniref:AraC family transcriptional regulator n=1 Tax=Alteromonas facilis TaxID=2048004 RepID=UPI001F0BB9DD|nr:AraC family transcriptional regulator [Alteromonas facilis]